MKIRTRRAVESSPQKEVARRRRERLAIGLVLVLVIGLTILEANLATVGGGVAFTSNIIIFALINLNVILVVLLIFLVTRNVFKVILDRKRNILGAKIRSRLVLIFISFSLVPTILLFVAAANITTSSIKSWIGGRVGVALNEALDIARRNLENEARLLFPLVERAAADAREGEAARAGDAGGGDGRPPRVSLMFVGPAGALRTDGEVPVQTANEILSRIKGGEAAVGETATFIGESFASAVRRLPDGGAVVAVKTLFPEEAHGIREIAKAYDEYHQVRLLDDPIRASYIATLVLITLLIVFAASWMGIYLARQITVPVQLLAEGTEKVASGDLDVRLEYRSDDEFGNLVASFNRMTADLKGMKRNLEDANVSLTDTYEELRRRTQFIETILTNISTGVIVIDRAGRIAMINKVAERLLGIRKEKVFGKPYKEAVREEHYEAVRALSRDVGMTPGRQLERQVSLSVGGKTVSLRVSVAVLHDDPGEYMGLVVAFDDLSQAMRLQKVLAWREVARRIAHEIRNPLTPIQLSTERLQKRFASAHEGDPAFRESTRTILSEVGSLKRLVEEFARFARMPAPLFKEGSVGDELRPVVETFRSSHPGIEWEFDEGSVPRAWFDPFQLRRAVTNLLDNAAAVLAGRGRVAVRCAYDPKLDAVKVSVSDDGPGIPPGDRDRLFEPYFSRVEGGTGLGLAIVSAIASDHRGTVRIRDNEPRGAVFEIEFPARSTEGG
jgi:two-component system, NtrC family, nitrogen regulation sensor histidine kinase NtrY